MSRPEPPPRAAGPGAPPPDPPPVNALPPPQTDGPVTEPRTRAPRPDAPRLDAERLAALPPLPRDDDGPVFAEPWQAQAFALAVTLSEQGHFTWKEWTGALADELRAAAAQGKPDDGSRYYHHWVTALERLAAAKGMTDAPALHTRKEAWADAYRHTPHGQPVVLRDRNGSAGASG